MFLRQRALLAALLFAAIVAPAWSAAQAAAGRPNIILILADDLGFGDIGANGATLIETPHIDRLAREGVRLSSFYASANVCTPSRAGLLTGRYAVRSGLGHRVIEAEARHGLPPEEVTIAEILHARGYATGIIGKWHLGHTPEHWPTQQGFDYYFGLPYSNDTYPLALYRNDESIEEPVDQSTLTERYTQEVIRFIRETGDQPFFVYLPHTFPHIPLHASRRFAGQSKAGLYGDVVEALDWSTGQILAELERLGIDGQTLVIFTSDNGAWFEGSNGPYRANKGHTWEGGYRVPFVARWPDGIPAGVESAAMSMNIDLLPTLATVSGAALPDGLTLDGRNIMPLLQGSADTPHEVLYFFDNEYIAALRTARWKLTLRSYYRRNYIAFDRIERMRLFDENYWLLFDMRHEQPERNSYARENPGIVKQMMELYAKGAKEFRPLAQQPASETIPR